MDFRILGPLEVVRNGESVDVGPHRQQSLLALLLLHANRVVPTDRILDELWGDDADGKENALWVYVSRLRGALERGSGHAEVLITKDHGYVLRVDAGTIDANRFESEVVRGRALLSEDAEGASIVLREALELWRGSPFQDFTYENWCQTEIGRLEELRVAATEDAVEADLRRGLAGELIGELEVLHKAHLLRERPVAQLMLALYRAGRSAEALRAFERFRRSIGEELGIDPSPELCRLEEQILLHDSRLQVRTTTPMARAVAGVVNPFRGLRSFAEEDAAVFFGRDRLVADAVRRIADEHRLIALVGPSGSGKSSVVRAGLIPAIRKGALPDSDRWLIAQMLPGNDPFIEFEAALLHSTIDAPDSLTETLHAEGSSGLLRAALRVLPVESERLVLVIDQFEELFTLVESEAVRRRFLDQLVVAIDDPYRRVQVVVTLRADFYRRPLEHAGFATRMSEGIVNVVPLTPDELEAAALEPASRCGATLEPALLAGLVADVIGQPGALPAFQYTLTELFDRRVGAALTFDAYRRMGGVRGSLTRNAEELYWQLDGDEQATAKQLLLRLVAVTEHGQWSRRRVPASELVSLDVDLVAMQRVIEVFAGHRLLSLDRDPATAAPTVEVAHEALLVEWERLRQWIEQNKDDLVRHLELAAASSRWAAADRDPDYLYAGGRLEEAQHWSGSSEITLTVEERAFLDAGVAVHRAEGAREEERLAREQSLERATRRRTWAMVAAVVLLVGVLGAVAWAAIRPPGPKIALVFEGTNGGQPQELMKVGWDLARRELGFQDAVVISLIDPKQDLRDLAEDGYELIVYGRYDQGAAAYAVAEEYPDTSFVILDGQDRTLDNVTTLGFAREGGAYLVGAAAALQSDTGNVGFIGGRQSDTTEARRVAFTAGARSIDPDIEVNAVYLGPYRDANWGFLDIELVHGTAEEMYRSGTDVIHHSAGDAGVGIAAAADELTRELGQDLWVIGTEVNERLAVPEYGSRYLTSMWKRWDRAVFDSVRAYLDDELSPGQRELGLDGGFVGYAEDGRIAPPDAVILNQISTDIESGTVVPPRAAVAPPRWTLAPSVDAEVVFDGGSCSIDAPETDVIAGDVVRVSIENRSPQPVEVVIGVASDGVDASDVRNLSSDPWTEGVLDARVQTLTAPGATNALSVRVRSGTHFIDCITPTAIIPGTEINVRYVTACTDPAVEPAGPREAVEALGAAINARNAAAVCGLFANDAPVPGAVVAEMITPADDDRWFVDSVGSDVEVAGDLVTWTVVTSGAVGEEFVQDFRAEVVDGRFLWIEPVTPG